MAARISIANTAKMDTSFIEKQYVALAKQLVDRVSEATEISVVITESSRSTGPVISVSVRASTQAVGAVPLVMVQRDFILSKSTGEWTLVHGILKLDPGIQGQRLSDIVNAAGAKALKQLKGSIIKTTANLDAGAYAWLRKGFWPSEGRAALTKLFVANKRLLGTKADELITRWRSLDEGQAKNFVLTDAFRQYKPALLNQTWAGSTDISNQKSYDLLTGAAVAQVLAPGSTASPLTASEQLYDALMRHNIYLKQYGNHVAAQVGDVLDRTEAELAGRIQKLLENQKGLKSPVGYAKLQKLKTVIGTIRGDAWDKANDELMNLMKDLAKTEVINVGATIEAVLPVTVQTVMPEPATLRAIATSKPFEGRTLKEWAESMKAADLQRITAAIQVGMVTGDSAADIAKGVVGSTSLTGIDGVTQITRTQLTSVVQTAIQGITTDARDALYAENNDLFDRERFVATLDSRTTPICRSLDGKLFPVGEGPNPPLHFRCRSLRVPSFGDPVGDRPANPTTERQLVVEYSEANDLGDITSRDKLPRGHKKQYDDYARKRKRELIGQVPGVTDYQTWLLSQSKDFQVDVLGATRAKLFREGGLTLDRFVDGGKQISLPELYQKEADAFKAAGVPPPKLK